MTAFTQRSTIRRLSMNDAPCLPTDNRPHHREPPPSISELDPRHVAGESNSGQLRKQRKSDKQQQQQQRKLGAGAEPRLSSFSGVTRLEPSKRDLAAQMERGLTIVEHLSANDLVRTEGNDSEGLYARMPNTERSRRRSVEPRGTSNNKESACSSKDPRRSWSQSKARKTSRRSSAVELMVPGEKLFVPDERRRYDSQSRRRSLMTGLSAPCESNGPNKKAGNCHQAERRRRRRNGAGRDALVNLLAKTAPQPMESKKNVNPKQKALWLLSPGGKDKAAVWEKRAAVSRLLMLDESKAEIAAPRLAQ